jgi:glycerol-3-phosphate dehydrogenase (NAD(P)+)
VSASKGLEQQTHQRVTEIVNEVLPGHPAGVLAGPNIAVEVMAGYAAAATIAMPDENLAVRLAELFRTSRFRLYSTTDVVGVEVGGALKNIYAIAVGMADGAGAGENTKAMVVTRAAREMSRLGEALGGHRDTFAGLAGIGDLIVTCTSPHSRNRQVGEALGRGRSTAEILAGMTQIAEGVKTTPVAIELADKLGVPLPIAGEVNGVLAGTATVQDAYRGLLRIPPGHETKGDEW